MVWSKKATTETIENDYPYSRFKLKMPDLDEHDRNNLKHAHDNATKLTKPQLKQLKKLARFISIFRFAYFPINTKILPTFCDLGLFVGSTHLWDEAYKWILLKDKHKYEDLDLDLTLALLTAVLAGSNDGLGADLWYRMGITRKLLKHLVKLIEVEQNYDER